MSSSFSLVAALEQFFFKKQEGYSKKSLQDAFQSMHRGYTSGDHNEMALRSMPEVIAYISARRIATLKSVEKVLYRLQEILPDFSPKTLLDVGSGPLTVLQSVLSVFPEPLDSARFIESNHLFCTIIDEALLAIAGHPEYRLIRADMSQSSTYHSLALEQIQYDIASMSYSLGEIPITSVESTILSLMSLSKLLILIEPGTPRGSNRLLLARDAILKNEGWAIVAPCSHQKSCPLSGSKEWCHEFVRLNRSHLAKEIKTGKLGYEDEPMSYLIAANRSAVSFSLDPYMRIVDRPQHRSGHSHFTVCAADGQLQEITISRRDVNRYKRVKKTEWGDLIPYTTEVES